GSRWRIGAPSLRKGVPWKVAGSQALPQFLGPPTGSPASFITTNAGRSWFSVPRPYVTQAPRLGRPARMLPVFIWQTLPTWFTPSAQHERTSAISSTTPAIFGYQSETQVPDCPNWANLRLEASRLLPPTPIAVKTLPKLGGTGSPARFFSSG